MAAGRVRSPARAVGAAGAAPGCLVLPVLSSAARTPASPAEGQCAQARAWTGKNGTHKFKHGVTCPFLKWFIVSVLELKRFTVFLNSVTAVSNFVVLSDTLVKRNVS